MPTWRECGKSNVESPVIICQLTNGIMKILQHSGSLLKTVWVDINKVSTQILDGQNWRGWSQEKQTDWEDLSLGSFISYNPKQLLFLQI